MASDRADEQTYSGSHESSPDQPLPRGTKIGAFIVEGPLGSGAMGTVLLARDPELARPVAIKLVAPGRGGEAAHQRLLREAQAAARLSHPNVVAIHQAGTWRDQVFIVMEYVDGGTLRQWLKETPRRWENILDAFHQAGQGLLAAHRAGLVHRDFKPDNVLIGRDGRVRVSDFGLVGVEGGAFQPDETIEGESLDLTRTGALVGTPAYMAPEQFEGSRVDARADQFAFAVALYEAFYGKRPYLGATVTNLLYSMSSGEIQPPPSSHVPRPIYAALLRALAANPEARYPSMAELMAALRREPSSPAAKHGTTLAVGVGAVVMAMGGTAAFFMLRSDDDPSAPVEESPEEPSTVDCAAQPALDGVWNDERRAAIAEAAGTKLVAALDRYASTWREISTEACQATRVDGKRSEEELGLQMACLEDRRTELEVFLGALGEEDAAILRGSLGAAARLAPVSACSDLGALRSVPAPPEDGELREAVTAVRRQRAHAAILLGAGRYLDALKAAQSALEQAEATSYEPEIVRVQAIVAESNLQLSRVVEAEKLARNVVERAASIREHDVEADGWQMVLTIAYSQGRLSDAYTIFESAKVAAARSGNAWLQAKLLNHAANLAYIVSHDASLQPEQRVAKLEAARDKANEALEAFEALPDPTVGLGNAYVVRAGVEVSLNNPEAARQDYSRASASLRRRSGRGTSSGQSFCRARPQSRRASGSSQRRRSSIARRRIATSKPTLTTSPRSIHSRSCPRRTSSSGTRRRRRRPSKKPSGSGRPKTEPCSPSSSTCCSDWVRSRGWLGAGLRRSSATRRGTTSRWRRTESGAFRSRALRSSWRTWPSRRGTSRGRFRLPRRRSRRCCRRSAPTTPPVESSSRSWRTLTRISAVATTRSPGWHRPTRWRLAMHCPKIS